MYGGRITSEEKSTLRTYIWMVIAVALAAGGIYFFVLDQKQQKEMYGFDPNRPIPTDEVLRKRLKSEEYAVVRQNGSETPFQNDFWNNSRAGLYVDVITGEPLFTSLDKYDNGLGIPAFSKPIAKDSLVERADTSEGMQRTQVRAKRSDARLGYVFPDPKSPTGQCYSIYSAALHFIPKEQLKDKGYESYASLLDKK
jgi:methionine-R-sulfoxide reductase